MKKNIIYTILIFIISSLIHSFYNYLPNFITSIFFSVNESIWEHMKMIYTSYIIFLLLKFTFDKLKDNEALIINITAIINIIVFLIIYIPIYIIFKEHLIVTLIIYLISIYISIILTDKLKNKINKKISNTLNKYIIFIIAFTYLIFAFLTYKPPKISLFYDTVNKTYGIYNKYN